MNNIHYIDTHESNRETILSFFLIILLLTSSDTLLFGTNSNELFGYVPRILGTIFVMWVILVKGLKRINYSNNKTLCFVMMISFMTVSSYINKTPYETALSRMISVIVAYTISNVISQKKYIEIFDNIMYFLVVIALITEVVAYVFPTLIGVLPKIVNAADNVFFNFFVGGISQKTLSEPFIRSSSIFWEPGAFAIYIVVALIFQLFVVENKSTKRCYIYLLGLFTTFSTTGFIGAIIILFVFFISGETKNSRTKLLGMFLLTCLVLFLVFGENTELYNKMFGKIINGESTAVTRIASVVNSIEIALDYPLFGVSPNNMSEYMTEYAMKSKLDLGANFMNTNTTLYQFAAFGIPFGTLFTIGTFKFFKKISTTKMVYCGLFISLILLYCGELFYSFFPYVFVFYGYSKDEELTE